MLVTPSGIVMEERLEQPENNSTFIAFSDEESVTVLRFIQLWKAFTPIDSTELGIVMDVRFEQFIKAIFPILFTELGMLMY